MSVSFQRKFLDWPGVECGSERLVVYLAVMMQRDALVRKAAEKKREYTQAAQAHHASFSPFVLTVDGLMAQEAHFAHFPLSGANPMMR